MSDGNANSDARSHLQAQVTLFACVRSPESREVISLGCFLDGVRDGRWADRVGAVREARASGSGDADVLKKALPIVKLSGVFRGQKAEDFVSHSGVLCLDFDDVADGMDNLRQRLTADPYVLAFFRSPSGNGLKVLVPVKATNPEEHKRCFERARGHFQSIVTGNGKLDPAPRNVSSGCFVSYDPELWIAGKDKVIERFRNEQTPIPNPIPISECSISHPYVAALAANAAVRSEAERRKEALPRALETIYSRYLAHRKVERGMRNSFLTKAIPALYPVVAPSVLRELLMLHYDLHAGVWSTRREAHEAEIESMLKRWEVKYANGLHPGARIHYESLADERQRSAFRICQDLAARGGGGFFMSFGELAQRLGIQCEQARRLMIGLVADKILCKSANGCHWAPGKRPKASVWKWLLCLHEDAGRMGEGRDFPSRIEKVELDVKGTADSDSISGQVLVPHWQGHRAGLMRSARQGAGNQRLSQSRHGPSAGGVIRSVPVNGSRKRA